MFAVADPLPALGRRSLALGGDGLGVAAEGVIVPAAAVDVAVLLELLPPGDPGVEVADARSQGLRRVLRRRVQHEFGEA